MDDNRYYISKLNVLQKKYKGLLEANSPNETETDTDSHRGFE